MTEDTPLLRQTLRTTAILVVPVAAFLAILSAVALFAVPPANPSATKEQRVVVAGDGAKQGHEAPAPRARATARARGGN